MFFFVTEKSNTPIVTSFIRYNVTPIESSALNDNLDLLCITGDFGFFVNLLLQKEIKGRFLLPLLSSEVFSDMFGKKLIYDLKLKPILGKVSLLEELLAPERGFYPNRMTYFFNINDLKGSNETSLESIERINFYLKKVNLLISAKEVKKTLKSILISTIENVIRKELNHETEEFYMEDIKKKNDDFFLSVIAEFILVAITYYSQEEIKDFLIKEFSERII